MKLGTKLKASGRRKRQRPTCNSRAATDALTEAPGACATEKAPQSESALANSVTVHSKWSDATLRSRTLEEFAAAEPYRHVVLRPFLGEAGLRAVRADLERLDAVEKETDLFRFFQTGDLAPRPPKEAQSATPAHSGKKRRVQRKHGGKKRCTSDVTSAAKVGPLAEAPALGALAQLFASDDFRSLCQDITHCGDLATRVDLSAQVYCRGAHLLCHDDVIGTRKLSFIYYITDPDDEWEAAEGGALELYPAAPGEPHGTPSSIPSKELLPLADSLAIFLVEPGVSFHAVREVRTERARVSLQGWLHAPSLELTEGFEKRNLATLQQILLGRKSAGSSITDGGNCPGGGASGSKDKQASEAGLRACEEPSGDLSADDIAVLKQWLAPEYLDAAHLKVIADRFGDASYALLTNFLREDISARLSDALRLADAEDGFAPGTAETPIPQYSVGATAGWQLVGPPHLRRYLRLGTEEGSGKCDGGEERHQQLGTLLRQVEEGLFKSGAFRKWLEACTQLAPRGVGRLELRRFRPGVDYTVAARSVMAAPEGAELDATLTFVRSDAEAVGKWESEDVGGFESYLAADDADETVEAQEVYRGDEEDGPLVNLPATSNALALVMRDPKTMRFVKFLSRDAPSSRLDVAASFDVDMPASSSSEIEAPGA